MDIKSQRERFARETGVSRETLAGFDVWFDLLRAWSPRINLVARSTMDEFWTRHALDSAQLFALAPKGATDWLDLGSGAGFPGLAMALMGRSRNKMRVTLVESNGKKAAFLRACIERTEAPADVICARIEDIPQKAYDVITARALAPLPKLMALSGRFFGPDSCGLFPKGEHVEDELSRLTGRWHGLIERRPSVTSARGVILRIHAPAKAKTE